MPVQLQAIEESDSLPRPLYREITDFLAGDPTTQQICGQGICGGAGAPGKPPPRQKS